MARKPLNLNALRAFEAAARARSISRAAEELHVSHAAISRHVRELERTLRCKLFVRVARGVELTEHGQILAQESTRAFDILDAAAARFAKPQRRRHRLAISADPSFAALWLLPRLSRFTARHPDIDLLVDPTPALVDFKAEDIDLAVRYGAGPWRGVTSEKLVDSELSLVASPLRLKADKLKVPADLARVPLIQDAQRDNWNAWLAAAGVADSVVPSGPTLIGDLAVAAAEAGQGYAIADQIQAGDALAAKRLVRPFETRVKRNAYHLVYPAGSELSKHARIFGAWLVAELKQSGT